MATRCVGTVGQRIHAHLRLATQRATATTGSRPRITDAARDSSADARAMRASYQRKGRRAHAQLTARVGRGSRHRRLGLRFPRCDYRRPGGGAVNRRLAHSRSHPESDLDRSLKLLYGGATGLLRMRPHSRIFWEEDWLLRSLDTIDGGWSARSQARRARRRAFRLRRHRRCRWQHRLAVHIAVVRFTGKHRRGKKRYRASGTASAGGA